MLGTYSVRLQLYRPTTISINQDDLLPLPVEWYALPATRRYRDCQLSTKEIDGLTARHLAPDGGRPSGALILAAPIHFGTRVSKTIA